MGSKTTMKTTLKAGRPSDQKEIKGLKDLVREQNSGMVRISFDLSKEDHKKLKIYAIEKSKKLSDVLRELIKSIT